MQRALNHGRDDVIASFAGRLRPNDVRVAVAAIGGLQLLPELQASTYRIEALAHAAVAACEGNRAPRRRDLAAWLTELGALVGNAEDPAEDVFAGRVVFEGQNYRVLEGLSEGGCFHLQLILSVVEDMPDAFQPLKEACRAALVLSEAICARAGTVPNELGAEFPKRSKIGEWELRPVRELASWVTFSDEDLDSLGVTLAAFQQFLLAPHERAVLSKSYGTSELYTKPMVLIDASLVVALPTAIGHAIRSFVIEACRNMSPQTIGVLRMKHLEAILKQVLESPIFGRIPFASIELSLNPVIATEPTEIEPGYWVQIVFVTDDLVGFEVDGLMGVASNSHQAEMLLDRNILEAQTYCEAQTGFKAGLSIVFTCGFGRGREMGIRVQDGNWFIETASEYDATVLSWRHDLELADILRLAMTERDLAAVGFEVPRMNSLLGKVSDALANRGHLIPHEALEDGMAGGLILMPQNSQLKQRLHYHQRNDIRVVCSPEGSAVTVRKTSGGRRSPSKVCRIYASASEARMGRFRAVWVNKKRTWWIETRPLSADARRPCVRSFMALEVWMEKAAPVLDATFPELSDLMSWELHIDPQPPANVEDFSPADIDEIGASIAINCDPVGKAVKIKVAGDFWRGLSHPDNRAEAALVEAFVRGTLQLHSVDVSRAAGLMQQIVISPQARQLHVFAPQDFRDHLRTGVEPNVVHVSKFQDAAMRIGLGWSGVQRPGGTVSGVQQCTQALNAITASAESALCEDLAQFNKKSLVLAALRNYEAAEIQGRRWKITASAIIALSEDEAATRAEIAESIFELNAVTLACRNLMEIGLHHSDPDGGLAVADIDLSRLMARAMMIVNLGGYSDAIRYGAMRPEIRVSPAGEVQIDAQFFDGVMDPIGREFSDIQVNYERKQYSRYLTVPQIPEAPEPQELEPVFESAWRAEFGNSLLTWRLTIDAIENLCFEWRVPWLILPRSDLLDYLERTVDGAATVVQHLESIPRPDWKQVPSGFNDGDRQPWRFRRRLSVARRPLLRFGNDETSDILVAPGIVREGFATTVRNMFDGNYDQARLASKAMRNWVSRVGDQKGKEFEINVGKAMEELGWTVLVNTTFSRILGKAPDEDPGDIDVLAWNGQGRIVLVECKRLQFAKTPSEVAKQLADFRGTVDAKGKPDLLSKHLRRWDLAKVHASRFASFCSIDCPTIEAALVFSNPVPMKYAVDQMAATLWVGTVSELGKI